MSQNVGPIRRSKNVQIRQESTAGREQRIEGITNSEHVNISQSDLAHIVATIAAEAEPILDMKLELEGQGVTDDQVRAVVQQSLEHELKKTESGAVPLELSEIQRACETINAISDIPNRIRDAAIELRGAAATVAGAGALLTTVPTHVLIVLFPMLFVLAGYTKRSSLHSIYKRMREQLRRLRSAKSLPS